MPYNSAVAWVLAALLHGLAVAAAFAGTPATFTFPDLSEIAYQQALKDTENGWRLMCFAAHPDDEDGATLAYYRYHCGVQTHVVIATRGEGGQNEIGPELYEELAVIRTKEMREAAKIQGAQLHFLDLPDFGFSKTLEETEEIWGEEETLRRVVHMIRQFRPHVIITHHGRMKDHGHHQALGKAVIEAFDIAADADKFPLPWLSPWQPLRLFIRDFERGGNAVITDIGRKDELRGKTYAEIAAAALRVHKSQGMEMFIERLLADNPKTHYDLLKHHNAPMPEELDESAPLFSGMEKKAYSVPTSEIPWYVGEVHYNSFLSHLRIHEMGGQLTLNLDDATVVHCQKVSGSYLMEQAYSYHHPYILAFGDASPDLKYLSTTGLFRTLDVYRYIPFLFPPINKGVQINFSFEVPQNIAFTIPQATQHRNMADYPSILRVAFWVYDVSRLNPYIQFDVAPPVLAVWRDKPYLHLLNPMSSRQTVKIHLTNYYPGANKAQVVIAQPEAWGASILKDISFNWEDEEQNLSLDIMLLKNTLPGDYPISVFVEGMPEPDSTLIRVVDMEVPEDKHVGIIHSYDNIFQTTLKKLGVRYTLIGAKDFNAKKLDQFTTIIVDSRAYAKRPDLVENNAKLLEYVKRGGTVLCMYHKTFDWPESGYAPYPITLSSNRVTREDAPMTMLVPEHPIFNTPNKITEADWDGWIQERGLYFPNRWDKAYTPLLHCEDPGETIPPGSCLIAEYGKGTYLYTSLVWYRQLRELHPGALRIFANMLAL